MIVRAVIVALCGAADVWMVVRLVKACRTGRIEANYGIWSVRSERVMFVLAVGAHVALLCFATTWGANALLGR